MCIICIKNVSHESNVPTCFQTLWPPGDTMKMLSKMSMCAKHFALIESN